MLKEKEIAREICQRSKSLTADAQVDLRKRLVLEGQEKAMRKLGAKKSKYTSKLVPNN